APGESPARAVVGDAERGVRHRVHLLDLRRESAAAFRKVGMGLRIPVIGFADYRENRDFEKNRMQPRTLDCDVDFARRGSRGTNRDEALLQLKQPEQIDEIALEEAPRSEVVE